MSARAKASGAVGTVVNGRIRDLNEHRALGMPVRKGMNQGHVVAHPRCSPKTLARRPFTMSPK